MAGVQAGALAVAVSNAGGLGSLPCALLSPNGIAKELTTIKAQTDKPCNVNFFCHAPPVSDASRESAWQSALAPYYKEYDIEPSSIPTGGGRAAFSTELAGLLEQFKPAVVSFHFGFAPPRFDCSS